jgi:hypothetical protein
MGKLLEPHEQGETENQEQRDTLVGRAWRKRSRNHVKERAADRRRGRKGNERHQ